MEFNAKALLLKKENGEWKEEEITIKNVVDIRAVFTPYESTVDQVNLDRYRKVYYTMGFLKDGIDARTVDMDDNRAYLVSPLLLVQCDDEKPIDLTEEVLQSIKNSIDFF